MKHFIKNLQGFSLLETLAAIAVLSLVVVGPLSVTISSSSYARLTKDNMVATYLAEEALESIQNQYDSLYIYCKKYASSTESGEYCEPTALEQTTGQTAWRLFKDKLAASSSQPTCYIPKGESLSTSYPGNSSGNENGCAFDYVHAQAASTDEFQRYEGGDTSCAYLVPVSTSTTIIVASTTGGGNYNELTEDGQEYVPGGGDYVTIRQVTATSTRYVCNGVTSHSVAGGKVSSKQYKRTITVDQLPTFETGPANEQYNDDLLIVSTVEFKAINGITQSVKVSRFMHARP